MNYKKTKLKKQSHLQLHKKKKEASQVALVVKNPPANSRVMRHTGLIPGS